MRAGGRPGATGAELETVCRLAELREFVFETRDLTRDSADRSQRRRRSPIRCVLAPARQRKAQVVTHSSTCGRTSRSKSAYGIWMTSVCVPALNAISGCRARSWVTYTFIP